MADLLRYNVAVGLNFSTQTDHNSVGQNKLAADFLHSVNFFSVGQRKFLSIGGDEISTSIGHMIGWEPKDEHGEYVHIDHSAPHSHEPMADKKKALERIISDFDKYALFKNINHPGGGTVAYEHFGEKRCDSFMDTDFDWIENKDYILSFDATESWNGGSGFLRTMYYFGSDEVHPFEALERVFHQWFRVLHTCAKFPSLGSSDTHDAGATRDRAGYKELVDGVKGTFGGLLPYIPAGIAYELFGSVEGALMYQELDYVEYALEEIALLPGSPRTYVYTGGKLSAETLADNIGHSFITSGPILFADIDGVIAGDTATISANNMLNLDIISHKPLHKIMVIADGELIKQIDLDNVMKVKQQVPLDLAGKKWVIVYAEGNNNYAYAYTNPIYLQK